MSVGQLLLKFLAWPWLWAQDLACKQNSEGLLPALTARDFALFLVPVAAFLFLSTILLPRFFKCKEPNWPKFLLFGVKSFVWTFWLATLGALCNFLVVLSNDGGGMRVLKSFGLFSLGRFPIDDKTRLVWLADYIVVDSLRPLAFFFPYDEQVSPGDIVMAVGAVLSWWVALIITCWAIQYAYRKIFVKTPTEF